MSGYLGDKAPVDQEISSNSTEPEINYQTQNNSIDPIKSSENDEETIIRLLEERLVVSSRKQKIGEVVIRKEIETRMVQVPVRFEKLIVEQISPEHKQLAEIDLRQGEISSVELTQSQGTEVSSFTPGLRASGYFSSPRIASLLLNAIALERNHGCEQVEVSILVEDEEHQKKYQQWFERCSQGLTPKPEK